MQETQTNLQVEENSGQQPYIYGQNQQNLQNTQDSSSISAPASNPPSAADQQQVLEFLQSEAAGPSYQNNTSQGLNPNLSQLGFIIASVIVLSALFMIYYRFFINRLRTKS